jgi:hypothetical protein
MQRRRWRWRRCCCGAGRASTPATATALNHACANRATDAETVRALLAAGARAGRDDGPRMIDEVLDEAARYLDVPPDLDVIDALLRAGAGASFRNFVREPFLEDAGELIEAGFPNVPRVLAAVEAPSTRARALASRPGSRRRSRRTGGTWPAAWAR